MGKHFPQTRRSLDRVQAKACLLNKDKDDINRKNYRDVIDTFGYNPVVTISTHQDGDTLDHLLVPKDCNIEFTNPEQGYKISDHYFVMTKIGYRRAQVHRKRIRY